MVFMTTETKKFFDELKRSLKHVIGNSDRALKDLQKLQKTKEDKLGKIYEAGNISKRLEKLFDVLDGFTAQKTNLTKLAEAADKSLSKILKENKKSLKNKM